MLLYLIHANNPEKTQYPINEVQGELKEELHKLLEKNEPQEETLKYILNAIEENRITEVAQLVKICIKINAVNTLRNYGYILTKCLFRKENEDEHKDL